MYPRLLIPILLLFSLTAPAAPEKDSGIYDVEVLVFENRLPDLFGDELQTRETSVQLRRRLENATPPDKTIENSYLKQVVADLLQRDGGYRILAHGHWQQTPGESGSKGSKPVRIASPATSSASELPELEGAVRLVLNRYLHLEVGMLYRDLSATGASTPAYQISDSRRIKSQETQYFDHPRFGVLVRVMPVGKDDTP